MLDRDRVLQSAATSVLPRLRQAVKSTHSVVQPRRAFESLEPRVMLSNTSTAAPNTNIHDVTNGPLAKAGSTLINLYLKYRDAQSSNSLSSFESDIASTNKLLDISDGKVDVAIETSSSVTTFEKSLKALGMSVESVDTADKVVIGYLPILDLKSVAARTDVDNINAQYKLMVHSQGIASDQAEVAMSISAARTTYNLSGLGVKVGVISDSVNQYEGGLATSVASGDLPGNVDVLSDGTRGDTDEGRAILEEVYDLAPKASLLFAAAGDTQTAFAAAVTSLRQAGARVIIDDIAFIDEPDFQPGVIDKAIDAAVATGVTYITSAGNSANSGFYQAANFVTGTLPDGTSGDLINFDPNGTAATKMTISFDEDTPFVLQWDDPYNGVTGTVNADLDVYLYNAAGTTVLYQANDNNFSTGVPIEILGDANTGVIPAGTYQIEIVAKNTSTASLPRYYEVQSFADDTIDLTTQFPVIQEGIIGHAEDPNVITVGAVDAYQVPTPEDSGGVITSEPYSSSGPVLRDRDATGALLSSPITIDKPDISATDNNNVSFDIGGGAVDSPEDPDTLPNFDGTSSAAGNAAGAAALLLQQSPTLTSAELLTFLQETAVPVNGQVAHTYDTSAGYGLIDLDLAAAALAGGGTAPTNPTNPSEPPAPEVFIDSVTPNPTNEAVNQIEIDFTQAVTGFNLADLSFQFNGGPNLLTSTQTLTSEDGIHWFLSGLATLDRSLGTYTLTLNSIGSGIENRYGEALLNSASTTFSKVRLLKLPQTPSNLAAVGISVGSIRLTFRDNSVDETDFVIERSNNAQFTSHVKSFTLPANSTSYTDGNLPTATRYYYRVYADSVNGTSDFSNTSSDFTFSRGEVLLDDRSSSGVDIEGDWTSSTDVAGYFGSDYLQDDDTGKGRKTVTYTPKLPAYGEYYIYAQWTAASNRSTKVPFLIYEKPGVPLATTYVNERTGGSGKVLLGEYILHSGTMSSVVISNAGTVGEVIADAVEFLPASTIPPAATSSQTTSADISRSAATKLKASDLADLVDN